MCQTLLTMVLTSVQMLAGTAASAADGLGLQDGDVVVFLGDELTDSPSPLNSDNYSVLVETFVTVRYPKLRVRWINAGWADDTAGRALLRLDRDVLVHHPNLVVVCLGLNDPEYLPFNEDKLLAFRRDLMAIVQRCREASTRVWLLSPPAIEEEKGRRGWVRRQGKPAAVDLQAIGYDATIARYANTVREVAKATESGFVDWYGECKSALEKARRRNPSFGFTQDGRVPMARGHALAAAALLEAWGAQPIRVLIDLNWPKGQAHIETHAGTTTSVPVVITEDGKRILELSGLPLPWPMAGGQRGTLEADWEAARLCTFLFRMSQPPARGIALQQQNPDGTSAQPLTISAAQLQAGFNLATIEPLRSNAAVTRLFKLVGTKNYYRYGTWRKLQLSPPKEPELAEAHRQLIAAWATYVRGCEDIIFNLSNTFDARLILAEATEPEQLWTRSPAAHQPPLAQPIPKTDRDQPPAPIEP